MYSDADAYSLHVGYADEARRIGSRACRASRTSAVDRILDAAKRSGAGPDPPGYGFLAENAALARACRDAGLTFVGPPPEAIEAMGSKQSTRRAA